MLLLERRWWAGEARRLRNQVCEMRLCGRRQGSVRCGKPNANNPARAVSVLISGGAQRGSARIIRKQVRPGVGKGGGGSTGCESGKKGRNVRAYKVEKIPPGSAWAPTVHGHTARCRRHQRRGKRPSGGGGEESAGAVRVRRNMGRGTTEPAACAASCWRLSQREEVPSYRLSCPRRRRGRERQARMVR